MKRNLNRVYRSNSTFQMTLTRMSFHHYFFALVFDSLFSLRGRERTRSPCSPSLSVLSSTCHARFLTFRIYSKIL